MCVARVECLRDLYVNVLFAIGGGVRVCVFAVSEGHNLGQQGLLLSYANFIILPQCCRIVVYLLILPVDIIVLFRY